MVDKSTEIEPGRHFDVSMRRMPSEKAVKHSFNWRLTQRPTTRDGTNPTARKFAKVREVTHYLFL